MPDWIGALGQLGPIGIALIILLIMWVLNRQTTRGYREEIARINKDHDAELEELRVNRAREIKELREEIAGLKEEIRSLREETTAERNARRVAEEQAHRLAIEKLVRGGPNAEPS
jgi:flagellar biosynthesis/type III secretory pathway M-ring protein FliF/YscJ